MPKPPDGAHTCSGCKKAVEILGSFSRCAPCREKARIAQTKRRAELAEAGYCRDGCGREADLPSNYCPECYAKSLARNGRRKC